MLKSCAVLTAEQQARFAELKGEPFDFTRCSGYSEEQLADLQDARERMLKLIKPYLERLEGEDDHHLPPERTEENKEPAGNG